MAIGRETDLSILLVGDVQRPEFREARELLAAITSGRTQSHCGMAGMTRETGRNADGTPFVGRSETPSYGGGKCALGSAGHRESASCAGAPQGPVCALTVEAAAELLAAGDFAPDAIIVAQAYPGQFSHAAVDRLRRLAPLARMLGLTGSWCEGEMRSGQPWPGAVRVYWHQWPARCGQELGRLAQGECPAWGLPVTASEEERLLAEADVPWPLRQGLIAIHARSFHAADMLAAACRSCGYASVWLCPPRGARVAGAVAALFDGSDLCGAEADELRQLAAALHPAPVIVLLSFPRVEDRDRAVALGATAVLSKPLHLGDLLWHLRIGQQTRPVGGRA